MKTHASNQSEEIANPARTARLRTQPAASAPADNAGAVDLRRHQQLANNSSQAMQLQSHAETLEGSRAAHPPVQRLAKPNNTGLPDQLKSGIESLSGMSMDHVKVHYNSDKPAQLQAHAYAQGNQIHLAPGQEKHLPHESWHLVQQAQGRVKPTMQLKSGLPGNDERSLEQEADTMGALALGAAQASETSTSDTPLASDQGVAQRVIAGLEIYVQDITLIPETWVNAYIDDLATMRSHTSGGDIATVYLQKVGVAPPRHLVPVNTGSHWDLRHVLENDTERTISTRMDGDCGLHVAHAMIEISNGRTIKDGEYAAPDDFIQSARIALSKAYRERNDPDAVRKMIASAFACVDTLPEAGFGPALHALLDATGLIDVEDQAHGFDMISLSNAIGPQNRATGNSDDDFESEEKGEYPPLLPTIANDHMASGYGDDEERKAQPRALSINAAYAAHKNGAPSSTWDDANAKDKKEAIWDKMDRDAFQQRTKDLLGVEGEQKVPTTNHVLAKGHLPQYEFNVANLRFGPNATLRADDPNERPDYNLGPNGALTPRSRRIASAFHAGDDTALKTEMKDDRPATQGEQDMLQWYISKDNWKETTKKWDGADEFWNAHKATYYAVDYDANPNSLEYFAKSVEGIPWVDTDAIPAPVQRTLGKLKNFISRGSIVQSEERKALSDMFQALRGNDAIIDDLSSLDVELAALIHKSDALTTGSVESLRARFAEFCTDAATRAIQEGGNFDVVAEDAESKLKDVVEEMRRHAEVDARRRWRDFVESGVKRRRSYVRKALMTKFFKFLSSEERSTIARMGNAGATNVQVPDLVELKREITYKAIGILKSDLLAEIAEWKPPAELGAADIAELMHVQDPAFSAFVENIKKSIADARKVEKFRTPAIIQSLRDYGLDPLKAFRKQTAKVAPSRVQAFRADLHRWLNAQEWQNQFGDSKPKNLANPDLFKLVTALKDAYD